MEVRHERSLDVGVYRWLYDVVGRPWYWVDRTRMTDEALAKVLSDPGVEVHVLYADDEPLDLATSDVVRYERVLDMQVGVLSREVEWRTRRGRRLVVRSRRLASLEDRHLAAIDYEVVALDGPVRVAVSSELVTHAPEAGSDDPRRGKGFAENVLVPIAARAARSFVVTTARCRKEHPATPRRAPQEGSAAAGGRTDGSGGPGPTRTADLTLIRRAL